MKTATTSIESEIKALEKQVIETRKRLVALRKQRSGERVEDFSLRTKDASTVRLSELFGDKTDLIIVHNMGKSCAHCTLWADGFNGVWRHLADRAGFALVSADDPPAMKDFSESRDWGFTCLSGADSDFTRSMGYLDENGDPQPGISTFKKDSSGNITRIAHTWFGPGDDFCGAWHIFDLLDYGSDGWSPKFAY